jgi:hypothetical protein
MIDIYLVRHAESCLNLLDNNREHKKIWREYISNIKEEYKRLRKPSSSYEPPLSVFGILQSFILRDYLHSHPINYDKVISSSLMRSIMTAMVTLSTINTPNTNVIHVIPYVKTFKGGSNIEANTVSDLKIKIKEFLLWFSIYGSRIYNLFLTITTHHIYRNKDDHTYSPLSPIKFHFPKINYNLLKSYENTNTVHHDGRSHFSSEQMFKKYISKLPATTSLIVFTHKTFIMDMIDNKYIPDNTSITKVSLLRENIDNNQTKHHHHHHELYYVPEPIREDLKIVPDVDIDTCNNKNKPFKQRYTRKITKNKYRNKNNNISLRRQ